MIDHVFYEALADVKHQQLLMFVVVIVIVIVLAFFQHKSIPMPPHFQCLIRHCSSPIQQPATYRHCF